MDDGFIWGVISGFERIVWLSTINILIATLRFPGVLLYMYYGGFTVKSFFVFQLVVALFEFFLLAAKSYKLLPKLDNKKRLVGHCNQLNLY